jgi:hypothetical protein
MAIRKVADKTIRETREKTGKRYGMKNPGASC